MQLITLTALLGLASSAFAATAEVHNNCPENIYITFTNATWQPTQYALATNGTYSQPRGGFGNSFGISKTADYFSTSTAKFIFGFTDSSVDQLLYWSVTNQDGDPFAGETWSVQPSDPNSAGIKSYDGGIVHTAPETSDITVTFC